MADKPITGIVRPPKTPLKDVHENFKPTEFGGGVGAGGKNMYTRKGAGLIDDDIMPYLMPRRGETLHNREEPESAIDTYNKGGSVKKHGSDTCVGPARYKHK